MKNAYTCLAIVFFVALSLIPPINFVVKNPPLEIWLWLVLIAGFLGVFTFFIKTSLVVRFIAFSAFVNCFFSAVPYLSFSSYISVIACCYFYILCTKIENWKIVFKALQAVVILNVFLMFMQFISHDPLLNFRVFHVEHYGIMGQHMQMASFIVIISALLLTVSKFYFLIPLAVALFCHSSWSFLCVALGCFVYLFQINAKLAGYLIISCALLFGVWVIKDHKISENMSSESGRFGVWKKSIELSNQRPWSGWGIGTYKDLFAPLSQMQCTPWRNAHNFIIQLIFEVGYPLTLCLVLSLGGLLWALFKAKAWLLLSGLVMITTDAFIHFPDRMIQAVPLLIVFFAFCKFNLRRSF